MADDQTPADRPDPAHHHADARGEGGWRQGSAAVGGAGADAGDQQSGRAVRPTVASWFSGVGGLDMGLERAGFRVVSHSEIEPHACAVLARHWPDVPNLGDITALRVPVERRGQDAAGHVGAGRADHGRLEDGDAGGSAAADWRTADVWAGGPPCQGFSIAGQRRGLRDHRSSLASVWLDLVGEHRPGAVLFENVPGILSSARGLDWHALLRALGDIGYWWAYRVLDGQWFGVPQRRRRVFLLALDAGRYPDPDGPGTVLGVGHRCGRNHQAEREAWALTAGRAGQGADIVRQAVTAKWSKGSSGPAGDEHHNLVIGTLRSHPRAGSADPGAVVLDGAPDHAGGGGAADGLAGRPHHRAAFVKGARARDAEGYETWRPDHVAPTLNAFDAGDVRATTLVAEPVDAVAEDDPLLPLGQDSKRYRVIGNGVITPCAEWIGHRLMDHLRT